MSENCSFLLKSDANLETIFSRLPKEALQHVTPQEMAGGKSVGFYFGPTVIDILEIYPVPKDDWEYQAEREEGTFEKIGIPDPVMVIIVYRSFAAVQRLLAMILFDQDGWFIDMDNGIRRIVKGVVEAKMHYGGGAY